MAKNNATLILCGLFLVLTTALVIWAYGRLDERQQTLSDLEAACADLRAEVRDLEEMWPRFKGMFMHKVRSPSRFEVGDTLKALARDAGLYDMSFQVSSQPRAGGGKERLVVIDFVASKDRAVARFMRCVDKAFRGQMSPKSLLLEKGMVAQGNGELATGLSGCYVLEWRSSRKGLIKGGTRG